MPCYSIDPGFANLVSRRQFGRGLFGIGVSALLGSHLAGITAASGQLAGATLTQIARYQGWRTTWDSIVPLPFQSGAAYPRAVLLYDRAAGDASILAFDEQGRSREIRSFSDWRGSWDAIVASGFPRLTGVAGLVAYDRGAGYAATMQLDAFGNLQTLRSDPNWRLSWSALVPLGTDGLLVYDRAAGYATYFTIDTAGAPREVRSYNDWRRTWDILTSGPFTTGALPGRDLLLYDRAARQAAGVTVGINGELTTFAQYAGWRGTWSAIHGGLFRFLSSAGSASAEVLLFDQGAREVEFLALGPNNARSSILMTPAPGLDRWTAITPIGPDLLLCYDRVNGVAALFVTNRAPVPTPTSTPSPAPSPTPTPAIEPIDRVTIRLDQGRGNDWDTYTATVGEPRTGVTRGSQIVSVRNESDKRIALIHRDRAGKRTGPVFLKAGELSDAFDGMLVAGEWEAAITGGKNEAPARITLDVRYEAR